MSLLPLDDFAPIFEPLSRCHVGLIQVQGNTGDALIAAATHQLLRTFEISWQHFAETNHGFDTLLFPGGGNMGTLYPQLAAFRQNLLRRGMPLAVLPQTFSGPEPGRFERLYVRDRTSLWFRPDATLAPDLALAWLPPRVDDAVLSTGLFLRDDQEATLQNPKNIGDPARLAQTPEAYAHLAGCFEHVITNRLHFAIAALHLGREVTLLPNSYHKNRSVYDTWLRDLGMRFSDTITPAHERACCLPGEAWRTIRKSAPAVSLPASPSPSS